MLQLFSFLLNALLSAYIFVLILRVVLQGVGVDALNPVAQFVAKLTDIIIKPLQGIIPSWQGFDLAVISAAIVIDLIRLILLVMLTEHALPSIAVLVLWPFVDVARFVLNLYFYAVILQVVMSWVNPSLQNPITTVLFQITNPILRPARQYIPQIANFDISPFLVIIILKVVEIILGSIIS